MALAALEHRVDKIRINPGNIGGHERYRQVIRKAKDERRAHAHRRQCRQPGTRPGREVRLTLARRPWSKVLSATSRLPKVEGYRDLIVSLKSSDVVTSIESYRLYASQANYPTHIGITEAGQPPYGVTKSACGLAPILLDGIGDTIRVSLLADKEVEITTAFDILQATQRRVRRPELIACPTCGRIEIDLEKLMGQLKERFGRPADSGQDQRARLYRQWSGRGAGGRPGHRCRQG